jgi:hypothetical protein
MIPGTAGKQPLLNHSTLMHCCCAALGCPRSRAAPSRHLMWAPSKETHILLKGICLDHREAHTHIKDTGGTINPKSVRPYRPRREISMLLPEPSHTLLLVTFVLYNPPRLTT